MVDIELDQKNICRTGISRGDDNVGGWGKVKTTREYFILQGKFLINSMKSWGLGIQLFVLLILKINHCVALISSRIVNWYMVHTKLILVLVVLRWWSLQQECYNANRYFSMAWDKPCFGSNEDKPCWS